MIRLIACGMMALTGAFFFSVFVSQDLRNLTDTQTGNVPWGLIVRYALAMAAGGAVAGLVFSGLFGRRGVGGWLLALIGGILAATLAGLAGSLIGDLPQSLSTGFSGDAIIRIFAGLLVVPLSITEQPIMAGVLLVMVALTHVLVKRARHA